ncbi:MAG TPA: hypothetical protein VE078_20535 [Thermoanaerobaculia bacterium]|nr:hypothetical protein [Thermoanaerobaculia bacterium]
MPPPRTVLASLALLLLGLHLVVSLPAAVRVSAQKLSHLFWTWGESPREERSRSFGPDYVSAIETIRRTVPRDGAYVLINGDPKDDGGPLWVKFDLAPRRAVYLGRLREGDDGSRLRKRMPRAARWVVIAYGGYRPPLLLERHELVRRLRERGHA